jgi:hypothetical protein
LGKQKIEIHIKTKAEIGKTESRNQPNQKLKAEI